MTHDYFAMAEKLLRDAELGHDSPTARQQHAVLLRGCAREQGVSEAERGRAEELAARLATDRGRLSWLGSSANVHCNIVVRSSVKKTGR